jgi:DNA-binding PadR family transcriptional regulator
MGIIADLLKEIPSAARYKSELENMEKENSSLKAQVEQLRQEIQRRDEIIQNYKSQTHDAPPNESQQQILVAITEAVSQAAMEHELQASLNLEPTNFKYHLHKLEEDGLIEENCAYFLLTQKGRKFMLDNGLVK